jgi:hypothetical protein
MKEDNKVVDLQTFKKKKEKKKENEKRRKIIDKIVKSAKKLDW